MHLPLFEPKRSAIIYFSPSSRYRKVTTCARLAVVPGSKVVSVLPVVIPSSEAHKTASESYKKRLSGGATATKRVERKEVDKKKTKITG